MKQKIKAIVTVVLLTFVFAKTNAADIIVTGPITSNTTWTVSNNYFLVGYVYVKSPATLTINAGVIVYGDSATKGSLIICRGAKINAIGTACKPIIFTSSAPEGNRHRGDWGGIIILGYAPINQPGDTAHIEGITSNPNTLYGGGLNPACGGGDCPNSVDNSGTLQYVRIEFAGVALAPNNEINGLTFGGVGSGTTVDHIQVSYSNDDAFEFFGGTVNCKYLVSYRNLDDDFDTDNGFSGHLQFLVALRDPNVADVSGSNGFESDNDAAGSTNSPNTSPVFSNVTWLAGGDTTNNVNYKRNVHIRRNSRMKIYNSILMGNTIGLYIDGAATQAVVATDTLLINNINANTWAPNKVVCSPVNAGVTALLIAANDFYSGNASVKLANPYFLSKPDFRPIVGSPALNSAEFNHSGLSDPFFTQVSYRGAFDGTNNWAGDWTAWDPINYDYNNVISINLTPTVSGTITKVRCPNSGAIDVSVTGLSSPNFSYVWTNAATTQDVSGLIAGTYKVTVGNEYNNCKAVQKSFTVGNLKPIFTTCSPTGSAITVYWSSNMQGAVSGFQIHYKKHTVSAYGSWTACGNGTSYTITGLLPNTQYDFQLRGVCGVTTYTLSSAVFSCTTLIARLENSDATSSINIFPNPSTGNFTVELGSLNSPVVNVKVTNLAGQLVYSNERQEVEGNNFSINLSNKAEGMYLVQVSDGVNVYVQHLNITK